MAGLKAWNGSAFVDGEPRIWNGSAFVAPSAIHIWDGSQFVKVWPNFVRQRINRSSTWTIPASWTKVPGWSSDGTYPAVVSSDSMIVTGSGSATVSFSASVQAAQHVQVRLMINGAQRAISAQGTGAVETGSWTGALADGDVIHLEAMQTWPGMTGSTAYIDVIPT